MARLERRAHRLSDNMYSLSPRSNMCSSDAHRSLQAALIPKDPQPRRSQYETKWSGRLVPKSLAAFAKMYTSVYEEKHVHRLVDMRND